jgi:purine-binding chemotaxis protein CheW
MAVQGAEQAQYLTFRIGGEEYGARILRIREIIRFEPLTKVPSTPPWVLGVLNLRGSVVPVVDLAAKLGLPASSIGRRTCVVVVEVDLGGESTLMGVVADAVSQVLDLGPGDIERPPSFGTRVRADYLEGMGRVGKGFVLLLDTDRVLSSRELLPANLFPEPAASPSPVGPAGAEAGTGETP